MNDFTTEELKILKKSLFFYSFDYTKASLDKAEEDKEIHALNIKLDKETELYDKIERLLRIKSHWKEDEENTQKRINKIYLDWCKEYERGNRDE